MTDRVLGDGAARCSDKKCEVCGELRTSHASKSKPKEESK